MSKYKRTAWVSQSARKQFNQNLVIVKNVNNNLKKSLLQLSIFYNNPMIIKKRQVGKGEKRNLQVIVIYDLVLRIDILINTVHEKIRLHYWESHSILFSQGKRILQEVSKNCILKTRRLYSYTNSSESMKGAHIKMHQFRI